MTQTQHEVIIYHLIVDPDDGEQTHVVQRLADEKFEDYKTFPAVGQATNYIDTDCRAGCAYLMFVNGCPYRDDLLFDHRTFLHEIYRLHGVLVHMELIQKQIKSQEAQIVSLRNDLSELEQLIEDNKGEKKYFDKKDEVFKSIKELLNNVD